MLWNHYQLYQFQVKRLIVCAYLSFIICISYNIGKSALPDIYVQRSRASAYISGKAQVPVLQLIFYTSGTLKICPNLMLTAQLAYIVTDADCDCGRYFNVFIMFPNISMTYPIVLISIMGLYSHQHGASLF